MNSIRRSALVPYSALEMYRLVADIAAYPEFLPWCSGTRILSADEDCVVAAIDITYSGVHKSFTTRNRLQPGKMMELRLEQGPFSHLHGYWLFDVLDDTSCKVSLDLEFAVSNKIVAKVMEPVFSKIAGELVDSFRARAEELYGRR